MVGVKHKGALHLTILAAFCMLACHTSVGSFDVLTADADVDVDQGLDGGVLVSGQDASEDGVQEDTGAQGDLPTEGTRTVLACAEGTTGVRPCFFEFAFDEARCGEGCSKLVIYFAGGGQNCAGGQLPQFAEDGYITACALLFGDVRETGRYPFHEEAERVDLLIRAIVSEPSIAQAWDGTSLLITGASHGATAPVVAMARTTMDEAPEWKGSEQTAVCFTDGIYDIAALDEMLGTEGEGGPCLDGASVLSHRRALGRYYPGEWVTEHACDNRHCACDPRHSPKMDEDTVVGVEPSRFSIRRWKLIECGSALDACELDVTPAEPIRALCDSIDASAEHSCIFESYPRVPHSQCAPARTCREWFDAL